MREAKSRRQNRCTLGLAVSCLAWGCAAPTLTRSPGPPPAPVASASGRTVENILSGFGAGEAQDRRLAIDLADARACADLASALEKRLERFEASTQALPTTAWPEGPQLLRRARQRLRTEHLAACRIGGRSERRQGNLIRVESRSRMDESDGLEALRHAFSLERPASSDTLAFDETVQRLASAFLVAAP